MGNTDEDLATARRPQIFPRFNDEEIARLSRFGEPRSYGRGEMVA
ncbi:hypothetical protein [Pelagerythrobacter rhizovicinus]|nr:hypothetical protein [Pelagerythrobacter rhizovicinus]